MQSRLFWSSVAGFCLGVFICTHISLGFGLVYCGLVLGLFLALLPQKTAFFLSFFCIAFSLGALRIQLSEPHSSEMLRQYENKKITVVGIVTAEPDARERNTRLTLNIIELQQGSSSSAISGRILIVAPPYSAISFGDKIRAEGELRTPEAFDTGLGRSFNYPAYLATKGITHELSFARVEVLAHYALPWYRYPEYGALIVKQQFEQGLSSVLPEPHAGLAAGITVGEKRGLGKEWSEIFQTVGLTHIIVLSGYNIMVVIGFFTWVVARKSARTQILSGVSVALFFMLMTGFASATLRASLMAMIAVYGRVSGRLYLASRALAVVATGIILWNPLVLSFDPGFQLSVLATAGLIWLSPLILRYIERVPENFGLREVLATSVGTQLAVLPLLLYQTGNLSIVSLPANLLVLCIIPLAMALSVFAGILGAFVGSWGVVAAFPAYILISYTLIVSKTLSMLPYAHVEIPAFSFFVLVCMYITLGAWIYTQKAAGK